MQAQIHPKFNTDVEVRCTCGNTFITGSTKDSISVEICSKCHPFYTGEQKFVDAKGNVDRFMKRAEEAKKFKAQISAKKAKKQEGKERDTKSLRELLGEV
jgi:large subunit ribosomal protein L31